MAEKPLSELIKDILDLPPGYTWHQAPTIAPNPELAGWGKFRVEVTDQVVLNYSQEEFLEIRDKLFGFAAEGKGEWQGYHLISADITVYTGEGTTDLRQLFMAFAKGEGIKYMDIMGWR